MENQSPVLVSVLWAAIFSGIRCVSDYDGQELVNSNNSTKHVPYREHITPEVYHRNKLLTTTTLQEDGSHSKDLTIIISAYGKQFVLDLTLNTNLFGRAYVEKYVYGNHKSFSLQSVNHTEQHCYYHGGLRTSVTPSSSSSFSSSSSSSSSSAAFSTCTGLRGQFTLKNDVYVVEPAPEDTVPSLSSVHFIVRDADFLHRNTSCGQDANPWMKTGDQKAQVLRTKRRSGENLVHVLEPTDSDDSTRYVELYVVNDFTQYTAFDQSKAVVIQRTKDIINIVSSLYRSLDIYVILVGIEVWTEKNFVEVEGNSENTLNQFLEYRRKRINPFHRNDNAQLIIGRQLETGIVGKAPIMTICTHKLSGGVNADHHYSLGAIATTIAHEMGHNFGFRHDDQSCQCDDPQCVMSGGGSRQLPSKWSSCSKQTLSDNFHQGMDYCLRNIPETTNLGAVCGNGFVEDGEDCDCGLEQDCKTKCCNASTCHLAPNATCASGKCCNLVTCQPSEAATVCRKERGFCDLPEFCDGKSERCPSDVFRIDGVECMNDMDDESYCYRGSCKTHDSQCRLLWGRTARMSDPLCFDLFNVIGGGLGHCGYSWINDSFTKCEKKDVLCGMLHCEHRSEKLMFWKEALTLTMPDSSPVIGGRRYDCKAAIMDVGLDMPDPGMTFDGTKCGDKQMCLSHRCVSIESLNASLCEGCNGRGVCNSLGQCHCDLDYSPPNCVSPGTGGSVHSGPAQRYPPSNRGLALGLCLFLLVILPICIVSIVLVYRNHNCLKFFALRWCRRCQSNFLKCKDKSSKVVDLSSPPPEVTVANGTGVAATQSATTANSSNNVRRPVSFRSGDISDPLLQSCTNPSLDVAPPRGKARVALTHSNSCSVPGTRDRTQNARTNNPKITRPNDNVAIVVPLRPAPPPPNPSFAFPKQNASKNNIVATKSPVDSNVSCRTEARLHPPSSLASNDRKTPGNAEVSRHAAPEKEASVEQTSIVSRLRCTFEGNDPSVDSSRDEKPSSAFRPTRPKFPPSVGSKASGPPSDLSKPAPPKRPPLRRPESFSAGAQVKPTATHLQHHASEVSGTAPKRPAFPPKPSP